MIEPASASKEIVIEHVPLNTRQRFHLVPPNGDRVPGAAIDVRIIVGARHHPCLALVAGVHGDEYDGILALQEVARELEPERIQGTLIIVPVANPFAFAAAQRRTPQDDKDLNRVFPGSRDGTVSDRLAHCLCVGLLRQADLVFSLHGSAAQGVLAPWIEFLNQPTRVGRASYEAARASGFPDLVALPMLPGVLQTALADLGVPVIEGEVGGLGATQRENVLYYKERVLAVARHVDTLPTPDSAPATGEKRIWHLCPVEAGASGIFLRDVTLRQTVRAGDRLGTLVDGRGEEVDTLRAPQDGVIGGYRNHAGVHPADRLFTLWTPAQVTVEQAPTPRSRP